MSCVRVCARVRAHARVFMFAVVCVLTVPVHAAAQTLELETTEEWVSVFPVPERKMLKLLSLISKFGSVNGNLDVGTGKASCISIKAGLNLLIMPLCNCTRNTGERKGNTSYFSAIEDLEKPDTSGSLCWFSVFILFMLLELRNRKLHIATTVVLSPFIPRFMKRESERTKTTWRKQAS